MVVLGEDPGCPVQESTRGGISTSLPPCPSNPFSANGFRCSGHSHVLISGPGLGPDLSDWDPVGDRKSKNGNIVVRTRPGKVVTRLRDPESSLGPRPGP